MRMRAHLLTRNWLLGRLLAEWIKSCAAMRLSSTVNPQTKNLHFGEFDSSMCFIPRGGVSQSFRVRDY